ncbi:hypothetical protein [Sphingomonas alba]|uniref:Lipoprotein n=1 Tax=Sphingomonas alba TaxID=2908208 RepID=A0ABT0RND0_9SPHN|nr:hypothetical protein [Sphingomonas alba]MCL6684100.1 hypothetical protein [Sphingomonas alba]
MRVIVGVACLVLLSGLAACKADPQGDGFADIKYGMTPEQLKPLGFECDADEYSCKQDDPAPASARATLFEKPVRLSVQMTEGKVAAINVLLMDYTDDELIDLYDKAYGSSKVYRARNALAALVERHIWTADSGATIVVSKLLDHGAAPAVPTFGGYGTSAVYRSPLLSAQSAAQ